MPVDSSVCGGPIVQNGILEKNRNERSRRQFLKSGTLGLMSWSITGSTLAKDDRIVRLGFVGVGKRGSGLVRLVLDIPGVEIPAICDINRDNLSRSLLDVENRRGKLPEGYSNGEEDFRRMVLREDLDAVITATPWEWHVPVAIAAMEAGKYAASEVPVAITLEECWVLVQSYESTGMPCMMLENVCYFRDVMAVLNMVSQGVFGELIHCEAGYQHDVRRSAKFDEDGNLLWRGLHSLYRNGNLYPTHGVGPIAQWLGINEDDRFSYLVSMSSKSSGLNHYIKKRFGNSHPNAEHMYALGDINTTLIKTRKGRTVTLYHDTQSPRPYDLIFRVQGTEGIYSGSLNSLYIDDGGHWPQWQPADAYIAQFEHQLWKDLGGLAKNYSHGGADYLEMVAFVKSVRDRTQTPIDVYDSVTWSAVAPLSEISVAHESAPVDFPDFTRNRKRRRLPEFSFY